ncbi:F-box domain [Macleaya cordata]|uniref:F-box domain n=1 Tax=Macleaya cordata TaxID=56857 RepID=A0A200PYN9_MACCD|nr:F-box domain [Macleaya cordata]
MANFGSSCNSSGISKKTSFLCNDFGEGRENRTVVERVVGESSLQRDFEDLSVSRRLVKSVSQKLRKKSHKNGGEEEGEDRRFSSGCLGLYGKGGGCKVGADTCDDFGDGSNRRKSSGEEIKGYQPICGTDETMVDCFSNGVAERFWKRGGRKEREFEEPPQSNRMELLLPDDLLEMCLVRLPLTALMAARLVCRKWRYVTTTPRFMQMRCDGLYQTPWLFLFGVVKDGYCTGHVHTLDVSLDRWHRINADVLKGRFLFSVTTIGDDVYVVGGCSSLTRFGTVDKSSFKTHKGVLVFSPLTRSWRKVASMKSARSSAVLGVFKVSSDCSIFRSHKDKKERRFPRSRVGGVSDVYEDPHRLSVRRQVGDAFDQTDALVDPRRKPCNFVKHERNFSNPKGFTRYVLIAVGGLGSWDEPLDSGEIFDPVSNKWMEIMKLPEDFGVVCSGVVFNESFYVYSETDKLAAYDLEKGMWIVIQTTQSPPRLHEYYPKLVSCNNRLFMLSVSWCDQDFQIDRREKAVRKLWELDLVLLTWTEISRHPDAPMDWNAAFVADKGRIFGIEMFKIFGQVLDFFTVCDASDLSLKWSHISRKHVAHELDASSCVTKSLAVLHL